MIKFFNSVVFTLLFTSIHESPSHYNIISVCFLLEKNLSPYTTNKNHYTFVAQRQVMGNWRWARFPRRQC